MTKVLYLLIMFSIENPTKSGVVVNTYPDELSCLKTESLLDQASNDKAYECHEFSFDIPKGKDK